MENKKILIKKKIIQKHEACNYELGYKCECNNKNCMILCKNNKSNNNGDSI